MTPAALSLWLARVANGLRLLPVGAARPVVRAYLARDPEAAAKVAGAWVDPFGQGERSVRMRPGSPFRRESDRVAEVYPLRGNGPKFGWVGIVWVLYGPGREVVRPTLAEAEAAVDALLAADGWVLGEEVSRG